MHSRCLQFNAFDMNLTQLTKKGQPRKRAPGAGRPTLPPGKRRVRRQICMKPAAWRNLERLADAAKAKNIHAYLETLFI